MSDGRGQVRGERARRRVVEAAREVLCKRGAAGVSMDAVAERAGVARTTVYRHFDDPAALITAAVDSCMPTPPPEHAEAPTSPHTVDTDPTRPVDDEPLAPHPSDGDDVARAATVLLRGLAEAVGAGPWGGLLPTVLAEADRDPAVATRLSVFVAERRGHLADVLESARRRGQLAADVDVDLLVDALAGVVYYRRLLRRRPVAADEVDGVVHALLAPHRVDHRRDP